MTRNQEIVKSIRERNYGYVGTKQWAAEATDAEILELVRLKDLVASKYNAVERRLGA